MWKNRWDQSHFVLQHHPVMTVKWIFQVHWIILLITWVLVAWQSRWIHWISRNILFIGCPIDIPFITITITNRNAFQIKVSIKLHPDRSTISIIYSKSQFLKDCLNFQTINIYLNLKLFELCFRPSDFKLRTEKISETGKSTFQRGINRISARFKMPNRLQSFVGTSKSSKSVSKTPWYII